MPIRGQNPHSLIPPKKSPSRKQDPRAPFPVPHFPTPSNFPSTIKIHQSSISPKSPSMCRANALSTRALSSSLLPLTLASLASLARLYSPPRKGFSPRTPSSPRGFGSSLPLCHSWRPADKATGQRSLFDFALLKPRVRLSDPPQPARGRTNRSEDELRRQVDSSSVPQPPAPSQKEPFRRILP